MSKTSKVLKIAFPAVGEMFLYTMVWVIDTIYIGNYGDTTGVTAVGFSSEIVYTTINIFIAVGISVGITSTVANSIGAQKKNEAEKYLSQGLLVGGILALLISLILGIFSYHILKFFGTTGEILLIGSRFMRVVAIGAFFNMICSILNSGLRGTGNTVVPLIVALIINIITITLDYILIYGKLGCRELGVVGSGIATTIAYFTGFLILLVYYIKYSDFKFKLNYMKKIEGSYAKKIIKLAIPSGLQEGAFSTSRILSLAFIMKLGDIAFAANQITTTIESVSFMPGWGFSVAATALVGQKIGAKDYKTAGEYAYISTIYGTGMMLICSILFLLIPRQLISIFINNPETIRLGTLCLMIAAIEQPFMAISMILGGALKGAGDTITPFIISVISSWVIRIPLMYYFLFGLKLQVHYVWLATGIQWTFDGIIMLYIFKIKKEKWKNKGKDI